MTVSPKSPKNLNTVEVLERKQYFKKIFYHLQDWVILLTSVTTYTMFLVMTVHYAIRQNSLQRYICLAALYIFGK